MGIPSHTKTAQTIAQTPSDHFKNIAKIWSFKTEINFVTARVVHKRARSELSKYFWFQWMIKPFSHWYRSHPAFSDKLTGWFLTNHCLAAKGFFIVKWVIRKRCHARADSFLVWDTACGKGMSQGFTGAGLLDREWNPTSPQWAQRAVGTEGIPRRDYGTNHIQEQPHPTSAPCQHESEGGFFFQAYSICKNYSPFLFVLFSNKLLLLFTLHPLPLTRSPVLHAGCGNSTQGWKGWVESWNHQICWKDHQSPAQDTPSNPTTFHVDGKRWKGLVCPALTLVPMGWIFGGAGKGLVLCWVIFALTWQLLPAWLLSPPSGWLHFNGPVTLLEMLLGWHVPNPVIYRWLLVWSCVLSSRHVSSDAVFQSIW